jgi:predicted metalloprotease with PDZ domain
MRKTTGIVIGTVALLLAPIIVSGETEVSTTYRITIPQENTHIAIVEAWLDPLETAFYMFPGANQFPARWATFVSDFEVRNSAGDDLPVTAADDGSWHLASVPAGPIMLRYQVNLEHETHDWDSGIDGAAYARDWGVFYTARSLFVVNGKDRDNITVDFELPPGWRVTTPWRGNTDDATLFMVASQQALATSLLFAGTHREIEVESGSFKFLLALGGEQVTAREDTFIELANGVLDYYTKLMGDTPRLSSSDQNDTPMVVISEADATDGEALGNNISILLKPGVDPMSEMIASLIFTHELFHLWNGKSFAPAGSDVEWFKEGFTNFYTLKALRNTGYLTEESCLDVLGEFFYPRYDSDSAVGTHSMTEGDLKHDHWGLIYVGGMFVALAQDQEIKMASSGQQSLDQLMRNMFDNFRDEAYTVADVEMALNDLTATDQGDFFRRYVRGTERMPVTRLLSEADIEVRQEDGRWIFDATTQSDLSPCYADP